MEYIANIITTSKIEMSDFFNITSTLEDVDVSVPTLIIGWKEVKKYFPGQDILNKKICDNIFWTFSKREKRYKYEEDLKEFITYVIKFMNDNITYRFFNYILSSEEKRNEFINYINKGNCSIYYNSRFLYIYNKSDSLILGVSLKDLEYIGINSKLFIESLNKNGNNIIINNLNFINNESQIIIKDNIKIVPYLNYLKNSDIYLKSDKYD